MMQGSKADNNACLHVICYLLNCVAMKQSVADGIKPGRREKKNPSVLAFLCQNIPYRGTSAPLSFKSLCHIFLWHKDFMRHYVGWRSGSVPWNGIFSWVQKPCVRLQTKDGWKFYETDVFH